jgi:hypothetical protein
MTSSLVRSARRIALTVAVAGIASIAVAPAALAAPKSMPETSNFIISDATGDKVRDLITCDPDNVHKQHNLCVELQTDSRF